MNAIILTPIAKGAIIPSGDFGFPRVFSELEPISPIREVNINANRSKLQDIYRRTYSIEFPFVFLIDSDVVVTKPQLEKLVENYRTGTTPCIRTKPTETSHVIGACCYLNGKDYININYLEHPDLCQCKKLPNPFYIDGVHATEIRYNRELLHVD